MKTTRLALFPLLAVVAAVSFACGSSSQESEGSTSEAKTIHPGGHEDLGHLLVAYPSGTTAPTNPPTVTIWPNGTGNTQNIAPGTSVRLVPGAWCVRIANPGGTTIEDCGVTITKGVTTEIDLVATTPKYDPSTTQVDFGPTVYLSSGFANPSGTQGNLYGVNWTATPPTNPIFLLPGTYTFSYNNGNLTPLTKTLTGGTTVSLDITAPDKRAHIVFRAPARDYATGLPQNACMGGAAYFLMWRTSANALTSEPSYGSSVSGVQAMNRFDLNDSQSLDLRVFPFAASDPAAWRYELYLHGQTKAISVTSGQTTTYTPERIDIDDVSVTDESGNTRLVAGTFQVYLQSTSGTWVPVQHNMYYSGTNSCINGLTTSTFATKHGVDVVAGTYKVVTTYQTALGTQTEEDVVTVP